MRQDQAFHDVLNRVQWSADDAYFSLRVIAPNDTTVENLGEKIAEGKVRVVSLERG